MTPLTPESFALVRNLVAELCGIVLGPDKMYLVKHRLEPVMRDRSITDFAEFVRVARLSSSLQIREAIIDAITTHETSFFRDNHPFDALKTFWLPEVAIKAQQAAKQSGGHKRIRVWSAACSHGQEPYSIAMMMRDFLDTLSVPSEQMFSVLATDISSEALAIARAGKFSQIDLARGIDPAALKKHFTGPSADGTFVVKPAVRKLVEFTRRNLVSAQAMISPDTTLGYFDLILCRNVLIYFDEPTRRRVLKQLLDALLPGGLLLIGAAESLHTLEPKLHSKRLGNTTVYQK